MRSVKQLAPLVLIGAMMAGCEKYGDVSPTAYAYAKALFSVTNRKRSEKLDAIAEQITESLAEEALSADEAGWLQEIIENARAGKWEQAHQACRRMMEEQIESTRES